MEHHLHFSWDEIRRRGYGAGNIAIFVFEDVPAITAKTVIKTASGG
jgi:hypothetical protein